MERKLATIARRNHAPKLSRDDAIHLSFRRDRARLAEVEGVADERGGALADEHLTSSARGACASWRAERPTSRPCALRSRSARATG
ncbi:MAG TPA: hypothetical protein VF025_02050 [Gaiellaceae bacterium]